jgi:hypothetical protein
MKQAFYYFRRQLNGEDLNGDTIDAERMWRVISSDLQAVMINLGDTDDPYLIFESLNYKGEPLTQADLVRNYVLMRFRHSDERGGEQETVYREIWQPLEESLDKALTEFLRHYTMKEGENVKVGGIYSAFKKHLATLVQEAGVKKELQAMSRYGRFYEMFLFPDRAPSPRLRDKLAVLRGLEMTTAYPLLLRLFDVHESGQLSEDDLVSCFQLIESFSVRRAVCNVPTNAYNKLFLQWAKNYPSDSHVEWLTAQMLAGTGGRRWPTDEEFRTALLTQPQYPKKSTRHILIALEEQFKHKERIDLTTTTIEHIMPQTLSSGWKHELGQDAMTINAELGNTIGNLTLTGYNSEMGNLSFEKKKAQLLTSHIELNRWICEQSSWGRHEIEARSKDIAKRALKIWKRPAPVEVG